MWPVFLCCCVSVLDELSIKTPCISHNFRKMFFQSLPCLIDWYCTTCVLHASENTISTWIQTFSKAREAETFLPKHLTLFQDFFSRQSELSPNDKTFKVSRKRKIYDKYTIKVLKNDLHSAHQPHSTPPDVKVQTCGRMEPNSHCWFVELCMLFFGQKQPTWFFCDMSTVHSVPETGRWCLFCSDVFYYYYSQWQYVFEKKDLLLY